MRLTKWGATRVSVVMWVSGAVASFAPSANASTAGDRQALADAQQYLSSESFSFQGLVAQLEFDGFSKAQATWRVSHSRANWNKQALYSAKNYLQTQAFSARGLIT